MNTKSNFQSQYPDAYFLELRVSDELTSYLRRQRWLQESETVVSIEKPGEGNMNFVARVVTDSRSFILKQALPWVFKYPQVAAPIERGTMEATFYQIIEDDPVLQQFVPAMIGFDEVSHVLAQEDLGANADFTFLYQASERITEHQRQRLLLFLSQLHQVQADPEEMQSLENRAMRVLNHEHIFHYPYVENNGLDLDTVLPGLQKLSLRYKQDDSLKGKISELGDLYLQNGDTLLHGDYYPGSWLRVDSEVRVIDPEFGFFGKPEFDVGVMMAHAMMVRNESYTPSLVLADYQASATFDESLAHAFAGAEVLRRILGLAQLPLPLSLEEREVLLQQAADKL